MDWEWSWCWHKVQPWHCPVPFPTPCPYKSLRVIDIADWKLQDVLETSSRGCEDPRPAGFKPPWISHLESIDAWGFFRRDIPSRWELCDALLVKTLCYIAKDGRAKWLGKNLSVWINSGRSGFYRKLFRVTIWLFHKFSTAYQCWNDAPLLWTDDNCAWLGSVLSLNYLFHCLLHTVCCSHEYINSVSSCLQWKGKQSFQRKKVCARLNWTEIVLSLFEGFCFWTTLNFPVISWNFFLCVDPLFFVCSSTQTFKTWIIWGWKTVSVAVIFRLCLSRALFRLPSLHTTQVTMLSEGTSLSESARDHNFSDVTLSSLG